MTLSIQIKMSKLAALGYDVLKYNDWAIVCQDGSSTLVYLSNTNEFLDIGDRDWQLTEYFLAYKQDIFNKNGNIKYRGCKLITSKGKKLLDKLKIDTKFDLVENCELAFVYTGKRGVYNNLIVINTAGKHVEIKLCNRFESVGKIDAIDSERYLIMLRDYSTPTFFSRKIIINTNSLTIEEDTDDSGYTTWSF